MRYKLKSINNSEIARNGETKQLEVKKLIDRMNSYSFDEMLELIGSEYQKHGRVIAEERMHKFAETIFTAILTSVDDKIEKDKEFRAWNLKAEKELNGYKDVECEEYLRNRFSNYTTWAEYCKPKAFAEWLKSNPRPKF